MPLRKKQKRVINIEVNKKPQHLRSEEDIKKIGDICTTLFNSDRMNALRKKK